MLASSIKTEMEDSNVKGVIAAVNTLANKVTISPSDGSANIVLNVIESTVLKNGVVVITIANLQVGKKVEAEYDSTSLNASYIKIENEIEHTPKHP
jgi:hypothetical protein